MKKNKLRNLLVSIIAISAIGTMVLYTSSKGEDFSPVFAYTNTDPSIYYSKLDTSKSGADFLEELRDLNDEKLKKLVGYNNMTSSYRYTDYASTYGSSKLTMFYSGSTASSGVTREHVWPDSHGGNKVEGDIHVIRPANKNENEGRGNSFYVEGMNDQYQGWDPANCGNASYRGDAARIIFYCLVADSRLNLLDATYHKTTSEENDDLMGKLSDMIKWNLTYPVTQREKNRNEGAEYLQGNRNPFIDHPEYVCKIWGDTNYETRQLCEQHSSDVPLTGVDLDYHDIELENSPYKLTATIKPYNATSVTLEWMSSNIRVAKVDAYGNVTPRGNGECTITCTAYRDAVSFSQVCNVKVSNFGPKPTPSTGGCGGEMLTTSILISLLSITGVGLMLIGRIKFKNKD